MFDYRKTVLYYLMTFAKNKLQQIFVTSQYVSSVDL